MSNLSGLLLRTLPSSLWTKYVYPNLYSLHNMPVQVSIFDFIFGIGSNLFYIKGRNI